MFPETIRFDMVENRKILAGIGIVSIIVIILIITGFIQTPFFGKPSLHVDTVSNTPTLNGAIVKFNIYNSGNSPAQNVIAHITLYDDKKNPVHTEDVFIGNLNPGEVKSLSPEFHGDYQRVKFFDVIPGTYRDLGNGKSQITFE